MKGLGRFLFFFLLLGLVAGLVLPLLFEQLLTIEETKAQKRAEATLKRAVQWYLINNGPPDHTMDTEEVKQALIPYYLNQWPGRRPIYCTIDPLGNIHIYSEGYHPNETWIRKIMKRWFGDSND